MYFVGGREKKQKQGDPRILAACRDGKTKGCVCFLVCLEKRRQGAAVVPLTKFIRLCLFGCLFTSQDL